MFQTFQTIDFQLVKQVLPELQQISGLILLRLRVLLVVAAVQLYRLDHLSDRVQREIRHHRALNRERPFVRVVQILERKII